VVSIQLVSPASGDRESGMGYSEKATVSIQLVSPASGDDWLRRIAKSVDKKFPFN